MKKAFSKHEPGKYVITDKVRELRVSELLWQPVGVEQVSLDVSDIPAEQTTTLDAGHVNRADTVTKQSTYSHNVIKLFFIDTGRELLVDAQCQYCHGLISESDNVAICPSCRAVHHLECWNAYHGCTTLGCVNNGMLSVKWSPAVLKAGSKKTVGNREENLTDKQKEYQPKKVEKKRKRK